MLTQDEVIALMKSSNSDTEWKANCNKVKKACDGYPLFWYATIVQSGIMADTTAKWGGGRPDAYLDYIDITEGWCNQRTA